jgi:hypothetical protein
MSKSPGEENAQAIFTSGSFQAGGWVGGPILAWSRETRVEQTAEFIVYDIEYPGRKGLCYIHVLKLYA